MISATTNFSNALALFRQGKISLLASIAGYGKTFVNFPVKNIVPDSDLTGNTWTLPGGITQLAAAGAVSGSAFKYVGTGAASSFLFTKSLVFDVIPGQSYVLSGYIDASHVTSGSPFWAVYNVGVTTPYASAAQVAGVSGRCTAVFTVPAGVYKVVVIFDTNNCTVTNATNLLASDPQVEAGSGFATAYSASATSNQVPWMVTIDDCSTLVHDMDGGADQVALAFHVTDRNGQVTADFPSFVFEGKQVTIQLGLPGLAQSDFITVFTGYVDTVASDNGNTEYIFNCLDISSRLSQVIYTVGDSGKPTDSNNPKTLLGHPIDILLNILSVQVGLAGGFIDTTKLQAYRDGPLSGMMMSFRLTQSVTAIDFIKNQLMKPIGGYLWVNSLGLITANFFVPLTTPTAVATFGPRVWLTDPGAEQVDMVNTVQFQFDKDDSSSTGSGNYLAQDTEIYQPSVTKYGQYGEQVIQADGLRSGFQGFFTARLVSRMIFGRYGLKNLKFDQNTSDALLPMCLIEPGDIIAITHPLIPDRAAGVIGITNKLFEVVDRTFKFSEGLMNFTMIDASYLSVLGNYKIAPNGTANYTAGSNTFMYLCNDTDKYSNNDAAHTLG